VRFEKEVLAQQKRFKEGLLGYVLTADWRHVLCVPFIYPVLVPILLLDAFKHARRRMQAHAHYHGFADYGDAENYRTELARLREELRQISAKESAPHA